MKAKVKIHDVAKLAGVSQPTVSKVLNNYPHIKASTRKRVLDAIEQLEFNPDSIARSLATNKTRTIGLIVGDIANPFYAETAKVILKEAHKSGYEVILLDTDYRHDQLKQGIKTLMAKRVDGVIIASITRQSHGIKSLLDAGLPIILYNRNLDDKSLSYVEMDNEKGASLALKHLINLGHRRIAYISGPTKYSSFHMRLQGYLNGITSNGNQFESEWIYEGPFEYENILAYTIKLLNSEPSKRPTAFLVATDQMAIAVMDAVNRNGLRIPDDISVIGFDNIDMAASPFIGLTTISQQKKRMALLAVTHIISKIEGTETNGTDVQLTLEPELIIRNTCGPIRDGGIQNGYTKSF